MHIWPCSIPKDSRTHTLTRLRATCQKNKQNTTQEVDLNRNAISINASWHPHILLYQRGSYGRKCLILINKRSKTLNSSGTEEQFCAHGTARLSGTPGNIKLINSTKRTAKMDDTDRQTDRRAAKLKDRPITAKAGEKKVIIAIKKQLCGGSCSHTFQHPRSANTTKNLNPRRCPHPSHRFFSICRLFNAGWLASGGQGQRDKMAGGVTVSVAWLRDGCEGPRASWPAGGAVLVSLQWSGRWFRVSTGTWKEASSRVSGPGRSSRWASAREWVGSSSGQSRWLPSHPEGRSPESHSVT